MPVRDYSLSTAVLAAVAERRGIPEDELPQPLYDSVDPDALDALFRNSRGRVTFEYLEYVVTVDTDHNVELTPIQEAESPNPFR